MPRPMQTLDNPLHGGTWVFALGARRPHLVSDKCTWRGGRHRERLLADLIHQTPSRRRMLPDALWTDRLSAYRGAFKRSHGCVCVGLNPRNSTCSCGPPIGIIDVRQ